MFFASSPKHFSQTSFLIDLDFEKVRPLGVFQQTMGAANSRLFSIAKSPEEEKVTISLLVEKEKVKIPYDLIRRIVGNALKEIIFADSFPRPFIASAERTGAAIFRKELNFARNRLLEEIAATDKDIEPLRLLTKVYKDYALPVKKNIDFTRQLEMIAKQDSFLSEKHPQLLDDFAKIIGGNYLVTNDDELFFVPHLFL